MNGAGIPLSLLCNCMTKLSSNRSIKKLPISGIARYWKRCKISLKTWNNLPGDAKPSSCCDRWLIFISILMAAIIAPWVLFSNEEVLKIMGVESAVNQRFKFMDRDGKIIGVIKNYHFQDVSEKIEPLTLFLRSKNRA